MEKFACLIIYQFYKMANKWKTYLFKTGNFESLIKGKLTILTVDLPVSKVANLPVFLSVKYEQFKSGKFASFLNLRIYEFRNGKICQLNEKENFPVL